MDAAGDDAYQLALRMLELIMKTTKYIFLGMGMVVLYEVQVANSVQDCWIEGLQEKTPGVR
jgi:hypothetical protein